MAERAVILGGYAKGTVEVASANTKIDPYPLEMESIADHIAALKERFLAAGALVRDAIEEASSEDLFTEVSRTLDRYAWFIGSNLAA